MAKKALRAGELTTTWYGLTKPTVGSSNDAWGGMINADLDQIDTVVHGIDVRTAGVSMNDNRIINGNFAVNQRGYVSGTALPANPTVANGYGHDRWKAGTAGCTYTFTAALPDTTITITAGTLTQIIEAGMIEGGVYTLSWTGTAQARVYQGTPTGSYAASPFTTAALPAGVNTVVEFNAGTVVRAKFELGSVATPFNRQSLAKSMVDCQRYYWDPANGGSTGAFVQGGWATGAASNASQSSIVLSVTMRATPTVVLRNQAFSGVTTGISPGGVISPQTLMFTTNTSGAGACYAAFNLTASAEL